MAAKPPPPPPPDDEPTPTVRARLTAGKDPRALVEFHLGYGLDPFGSVGFRVAYESGLAPEDANDPRRLFNRVCAIATEEFNDRDAEVRRALGKRFKAPHPAPANLRGD